MFFYSSIADALEWCIRQHGGVQFIDHYLDDFVVVEPPYSDACSWVGVPLAPENRRALQHS